MRDEIGSDYICIKDFGIYAACCIYSRMDLRVSESVTEKDQEWPPVERDTPIHPNELAEFFKKIE